MMRIIPRILIIGALSWLAWLLFLEVGDIWSLEPGHPEYDPTQIVIYFIGVVALGIAAGFVFAITILPSIGDAFGHFFFTPDQQIEKDPHAAAIACIAAGDYEEAVAEYRRLIDRDPSDTHAASEVARLLSEKLEDPAAAAVFLQECLENDRSEEQVAFLIERIVVLYLEHLNDPNAALPLLRRLVNEYEGTSHAANAMHQIRQLESNFGLSYGTLNTDGALIQAVDGAANGDIALEDSAFADAEPEPDSREDSKA